jgi:O-antigen ligase
LSAALAPALPREAVNAKLVGLVRAGALALGVMLSGFVIREPAPYDIYMVALIAVWALFGLRISRAIVPLVVLLALFVIGGLVSMTQMADLADTPLYLMVTGFLALTAIFFAAVTEARPDFYPLILKTWVVSAVATSLLGIAGYFSLFPGARVFTLYDRAAGAFQDPNVFGPFLVTPAIYLLHGLLTDRAGRAPLYALPLLVIAAGLFLSFSRGAWGLFAVCSALVAAALFLQSTSGRFRLRIAAMSVSALVLMALAVLVVLQVPGVAEMFSARAELVQEYDGGRLGRFARYAIGFPMALEHPFGIGPLVFGQIFGEDTHNIWLKALFDYSWLGFAAYLTLMLWTLAAGFRILFRARPWQPYLLCAYVVLIGHVALGSVIDIDHWRHAYMLFGLVWGAIALEQRHRQGRLPNPIDPRRAPSYTRPGSERSAAR